MAFKIAFFDTKPYDRASFDEVNEKYGFEILYHKGQLNRNNVVLTQGMDAICIFVHDTADTAIIEQMAGYGVKLIALRAAGYNNVDLAAAKDKLKVVRVPAYSPYAVAEHAVALMLALNRQIHRAYWRTRDGNFALHGLMGFRYEWENSRNYRDWEDCTDSDPDFAGVRYERSGLTPFIRMKKYAREVGISYVSLDGLYAQADMISLHVPLTDQTKNTDRRTALSRKMKEGTIIINTSRETIDPYQCLDRRVEK